MAVARTLLVRCWVMFLRNEPGHPESMIRQSACDRGEVDPAGLDAESFGDVRLGAQGEFDQVGGTRSGTAGEGCTLVRFELDVLGRRRPPRRMTSSTVSSESSGIFGGWHRAVLS